MSSCILCTSIGKNRKYFFKSKPLCDTDYITYLEFLIQSMNENVTSESANDAFSALENSLKLAPTPKPMPMPKPVEPDDDEPYSMSMGM